MVTVRQSITALYEEAQRSAVESAPMLAVLQSDAACPDALPALADMNKTIPLPATAIATRFEELRRLAELEADAIPSRLPAGDEALSGVPNDPLAGIDLSARFTDKAKESRSDAAKASTANDDEVVAPVMNDTAGIPFIDIPEREFDAAPENTGEPIPEQPRNATPPSQAFTGIETGPSLPEEPPAPASTNTGDNLDIADIHTLVREAWEDETALGEIASPEAGEQTADHHAEAADITATGNIETAMQEIAAAVVQSVDSEQGINVEALKCEIIAAMRAELQAVVGSDLKSVIKTAVAEAMADMPAEAPPGGQATHPPPKAARKTTAKKAAKAAAKTAPKKAAAKKKPANGKAVKDNDS
jgi:hypothetical protein